MFARLNWEVLKRRQRDKNYLAWCIREGLAEDSVFIAKMGGMGKWRVSVEDANGRQYYLRSDELRLFEPTENLEDWL